MKPVRKIVWINGEPIVKLVIPDVDEYIRQCEELAHS